MKLIISTFILIGGLTLFPDNASAELHRGNLNTALEHSLSQAESLRSRWRESSYNTRPTQLLSKRQKRLIRQKHQQVMIANTK